MVDVFAIYLFSSPFLIFLYIWRKLGGWPEAYWRIRRIPYFCVHIFDAGGQDNRYVLPMSEIQHKSEAGFDLNGKRRLTSEEDMGHDTGRPAWWYNYNEMRPIPMFSWMKGGKQWDASLVGAAYENRSIEDMHRIGRRGVPGLWLFVIALLVLVLIVAAAGVYFAYNNYCAIEPARCAGGSLPRIA